MNEHFFLYIYLLLNILSWLADWQQQFSWRWIWSNTRGVFLSLVGIYIRRKSDQTRSPVRTLWHTTYGVLDGEGTNEPMCFMLNETLGCKINHLLSILNYKSNSLKYIYPSIFIASIRPFSTPPIWGTVIMWARCSFFFKWRASPGGLRNHCYHVLSIRLCYKAEVVISCHPIVVHWLLLVSGEFHFKSRSNSLVVYYFLEGHNVCPGQLWWCHRGSPVDPSVEHGHDAHDWNDNDFKIHLVGFGLVPNFRLKTEVKPPPIYRSPSRHTSSDQSSKVEKNVW